MPTMADLGALASTLYVGNPSIGAKKDVSNLDFDEESTTAIALGLTPTFYLWSGEEGSSDFAYYRYFGSTYAGWYGGLRYDGSYVRGVCLGG